MTNMTTLNDVEELLLSFAPSRMNGADYQLERIGGLLARVGNPQNKLKVVHVAGTSGKTSTSYYCRALLESMGVRVGLTVSPHIQTICERVQIHGGPISDDAFVAYFNEFYPLVSGFEPRPTYFELMTAFAYWVFEKEQVDYAVVEVGLGGRYDATNTVLRDDKVCIINSIGYDHTELFGESLAVIAHEKAGIIQENNAVFTVKQTSEAGVVIEDEAQKKHAVLTTVDVIIDSSSPLPAFQQQNFELALAGVQYVANRDHLTLPADTAELARNVAVPGRFERYKIGEKTVLLDGAHNPQKLEALIQSLPKHDVAKTVVIAAISDAPEKKVAECVRLISTIAEKTVYTTFTIQRDVTRHSVEFAQLSKLVREQDLCIEESTEALTEALRGSEELLVVTGSLYLVSILRPFVQQMAELSA